MRRILCRLAASVLVGSGAAGCGDGTCASMTDRGTPADAAAAADPANEVVYLETKGVAGPETEAVAKALSALEGVRAFAWTPDGARVVRERGKAPDDALFSTAKAAGADDVSRVPVATSSLVFSKPLHCAGCVKEVKKAVTALPGVKSVEVAESKTNVVVVYDARTTKASDVEAALAAIQRPAKATPAP
jgi:copper chaperone CopZ